MSQPVFLKDFEKETPVKRELLFWWQQVESKLLLKYQLTPWHDVIWPTNKESQRSYELWRSTCFELFVAKENGTEYLEYNFAPDGRWDAYHFTSYRAPSSPERLPMKEPIIRSQPGILEVELERPWQTYPLRANATAVIEDRTGVHYFAYCHNREKPDFHCPQALTLKL